mgnify:CR=1 FL=1
MLFILTMEPLQRLFQQATQRGLLESLASRGMRQRLSIFADDVVVFIKPKPGELEAAKCIFEIFGEASGLRMNMAKSAALPIRCSDQEIDMTSNVLGCPTGSFPIKYLGMPVSYANLKISDWEFIVSKYLKRFEAWIGNAASMGGRHTLLDSVVT